MVSPFCGRGNTCLFFVCLNLTAMMLCGHCLPYYLYLDCCKVCPRYDLQFIMMKNHGVTIPALKAGPLEYGQDYVLSMPWWVAAGWCVIFLHVLPVRIFSTLLYYYLKVLVAVTLWYLYLSICQLRGDFTKVTLYPHLSPDYKDTGCHLLRLPHRLIWGHSSGY